MVHYSANVSVCPQSMSFRLQYPMVIQNILQVSGVHLFPMDGSHLQQKFLLSCLRSDRMVICYLRASERV